MFMFTQVLLGVASDWKSKIMTAVDNILVPILVIACSIGMVYAIVVGIKMMKADTKDQREENKARLINIAISIVAIAVLIALFYALRSWIGGKTTLENDMKDIISNVGSPIRNTVALAKQCVRLAVFRC